MSLMKKFLIPLILVAILSIIFIVRNQERREVASMDFNKTSSNVTITLVYDNNEYQEGLTTDWGFSCFIKVGDKTILFDTGSNADILLGNMKKLGLDPKEIEIVFLSHVHRDHTGGLMGILDVNPNVEVYLPKSFPEDFKKMIESYGSSVVEVSSPTNVCDGVYSTGELGTWIKEQSLVIRSMRGLVIVTGCSHPGIVNIIRKAKELTNADVYLVVGGFHLIGASDEEIKDIVKSFKSLGVKKVAPSHCTGERAIEEFEKVYKSNFIRVGVGKKIEI